MIPIVYFIALAFLWWRLIDHLHVEWSVNSQYSYGYAVPFLCLYLIWRRIGRASPPTGSANVSVGVPAPRPTLHTLSHPSRTWPLLLGAIFYAPTRLVQEANPEWRFVSWALALEVITITLLVLQLLTGNWRPLFGRRTSPENANPQLRTRDFIFPICFFLVAVPWPTIVEGPLIRALTNSSAATTVEALTFLEVPALQLGSIIEVSSGAVGIDDACSGIRSFQATLMIALFFGEVYALTARRRVLCVLAGFTLSFLFNVARTTLLTFVAARKGPGAIAAWHDPAGATILVACFVALWAVAVLLKSRTSRVGAQSSIAPLSIPPAASAEPMAEQPSTLLSQPLASTEYDFRSQSTPLYLRAVAVALLVWLSLIELGTELWYRAHESPLPKAAVWHVELPRESANFRQIPFSDKTKQLLRYDEGLNGSWEVDGKRWQAIFLRWNPGRIAVHLAKGHTPAACLTATGHELTSQSDLYTLPIKGLQLPFRSYEATDETGRGALHVFYCLWEDRADTQFFGAVSATYASRLGPVLAGRRNGGQRSLEVAVWGLTDATQAEEALRKQLESLIKVDR